MVGGCSLTLSERPNPQPSIKTLNTPPARRSAILPAAGRRAAMATMSQLRNAAAGAIHGPCIVDVSEKNILNYAQGSYSLVRRDVELLPPASCNAALAAANAAGVADAFAVRRELISFKKVCLNVFDSAQALEKDLQQLTTFHYYRTEPADAGAGLAASFVHSAMYTKASRMLQRCRGSLGSIHDARKVTKLICSIPRHPDSPRLPQLVALLRHGGSKLTVRQLLLAAHGFIREVTVAMGRDPPPRSLKPEPQPESGWESESKVQLTELHGQLEGAGLAADEVTYVLQSVIARGGAKALQIVRELSRFSAVLGSLPGQVADTIVALEGTLAELASQPRRSSDTRQHEEEQPPISTTSKVAELATLATHGDKKLQQLRAAHQVVTECDHWVRQLLAQRAGDAPLFVAANMEDTLSQSAMVVPHGFSLAKGLCECRGTRCVPPAPIYSNTTDLFRS
eukprot:COSAG05_NODE_410_length_10109_cov_29.470430_1_plen_454_part_00